LQPPKIFSVSRLPPILLPFLALIIATPAPAAPAENAGDRILTTPARETTVARESRLRTTLAALAPADFSAAAEATRTEFARLLVLDVERDFADAIALLEPLLARATAAARPTSTPSNPSNPPSASPAPTPAAMPRPAPFSTPPALPPPPASAPTTPRLSICAATAPRSSSASAKPPPPRLSSATSPPSSHRRDPDSDAALHARTQWMISLGRLGRWPAAEVEIRDIIARRTRLLGPDDPKLAHQLNLLCWVLYSTDRSAEAIPVMEQLVSIRTRELGPDSAKTLTVRYNLAAVYARAQRYDDAEQILRTDLARIETRDDETRDEAPDYLYKLGELALYRDRPADAVSYLVRTEQLYRQAQPDAKRDLEQRDLEKTLLLLARAHLAHADSAAARPITAEWLTLHEAFFNLHLTYTSEADRLALLAHERPFDLPGALGDPAILARASLRLKGLVLDSLLEDQALARASADPAAARLLADYRAALASASASPHPASALDLSKLEQLERELARRALAPLAHRHALTADPAAVLAQLASHEALVDFISYRHEIPGQPAEQRYLALIGTTTGWQTIPLGVAAPIDAAVARYDILVSRGGPIDWARDLRRRVLDPVRAALPAAITQLYLSPDGALHGVAFATLPEDEAGRWATDQFEIAMIASARDLLPRPEAGLTGAGPALVLAAPTWQGPLAALAPLPGAHAEGTAVAALFAGSILLAGAEATPAALAAAVSPRLLHIATHALTPAEPDLVANDRLRRSGLALAGASGLLDALQIAALDLRATELVFLSGCATGSGQVAQGEGVLGLRRGFARAGTRALVLTLWPVSDQDSRDLTAYFYAALTAGQTPVPALRSAQLRFINELSKGGVDPAEILRRAGAHTISVRL
jgi:CHAT domain-containing protein